MDPLHKSPCVTETPILNKYIDHHSDKDQNQNKENSPQPATRLTRSTSWFNRPSFRKTPTKKRSFGVFSDSSLSHGKSRLNKSDWDIRKSSGSQWTPSSSSFLTSNRMSSPASSRCPPTSSKSTDCLEADSISSCSDRIPSMRFDELPTVALPSPINDMDVSVTSRPSCHKAPLNASMPSQRYHFDVSDASVTSASPQHRIRHLKRLNGVIRLNASKSSESFSTLALEELDESRTDLSSLVLNMSADEIGGQIGQAHPNHYYTIDSRRLASKHKKSQRDRKLLYGVKQFNLDPKRGLQYLHDSGFVDYESSSSVATFLFRQERLSKKQIGAYLGSHLEFNKEVLSHFVACHEFSKLLLVQALRQFLWSFRLPGEAMQIDRVMDAFSSHYCSQNKNLFEENDTCFILSFSIIMLNTALHNPNAKMKITSEQFIKQNKGINSGQDLAPDMLDAIFRNIKEEPFKIPDETYDDLMYTFFSPEREGWLLKQGGGWKSWKRRWFILNDRCLYYFEHTAENVPKGIIPLENVRVRQCEDKDGKEFCFEIYSDELAVIKGCKTDSRGTVVQGNHKQYRMSANSQEDRDFWIQCIQESIREHPFYQIISDKKAAIRRRSGPRPNPAMTS